MCRGGGLLVSFDLIAGPADWQLFCCKICEGMGVAVGRGGLKRFKYMKATRQCIRGICGQRPLNWDGLGGVHRTDRDCWAGNQTAM